MDSYTSKEAKKALSYLDGKGIKIGDLSYLSTADRMQDNLLNSNPNISDFVKLDLQSKYISCMKIADEEFDKRGELTFKDEIKEVYYASYSWMKYLDYEFTGEVKEKIHADVIIGIDKILSGLMRYFGINTGREKSFFNSSSTIKSLLRKDPTLPKDIRLDTIVEAISRPEIYLDSENVINVLLAMGCTVSTAVLIDKELQSNPVAKFNNRDNEFKTYSFGDEILPGCDFYGFSQENIKVLSSLNKKIEPFLTEVCLSLVLENYVHTGKIEGIKAVLKDDGKKLFLKEFLLLSSTNIYGTQMIIGDISLND